MEILNKYVYDPKRDILGKGGFATVYKAHDKILDMPVALKFFHPQDTSNKYNIINEIRRAIMMAHPNIVRYYGVETLTTRDVHGEEEEIQIGVMEYVQEGQLKDYLNRNPLLQTELVDLFIGILEGLKYLHSQGIIHRDIKPQNILLGRDKQDKLIAKIADFGISKNVDSSHTSSSVLLGTVEYMAPEQFNPERYGINKKVSFNVDIWSFGITVYYLVTGEHMFGARSGETSPGELINKIVNVENLEEKLRALQEPFKTLVARCVVPDAKSRTSNIDDLISILNGHAFKIHTSVSVNVITNNVPPVATVSEETIAIPKSKVSEETKVIEKPVPKTDPVVAVQQEVKTPKKAVLPVSNASAGKKKVNRTILVSVLCFLAVAVGGSFYIHHKIRAEQAEAQRQSELQAAAAAEEEKKGEKVRVILDSIDKLMVSIDPAEFTMGSNKTTNESPAYTAKVDYYELMQVEVTRGLWNMVMEDKRFPAEEHKLPANNITWNEANSFNIRLNELNEKYGQKKLKYRMPTEEEWEWAYMLGHEYEPGAGDFNVIKHVGAPNDINRFSWNKNNSGGRLHEGGQRAASMIGIYDMLGNVYEWCKDNYGPYDSKKKGEGKVLRGGDYKNDSYFVSGKIRNVEFPDKSNENIGFRIARTRFY